MAFLEETFHLFVEISMENWYQKFQFIVNSAMDGNNDEHLQSFNLFNEMVKLIPDKLSLFFFKIIYETENEQEITLSFVLFGRFLNLIIKDQILLTDESIESIKSSIISLFETYDFTQYQLDIISNDILLLFEYLQYNWPEILELFLNGVNSDNPKINTSAANCLSQCIQNCVIDIENYDILFEIVIDFLQTFDESYIPKITSFLRLFYSLANFHYFEPIEIFTPLLNDLPDILRLTNQDPQIIIDFYHYIKFDSFIFESSFHYYFDVFIDMISDANYKFIGNTIILTLDNLITSFYDALSPEANSIFIFLSDNLDNPDLQETLRYILSNLSKLYGNNEDFSNNVFEYLKEKFPDPLAFIAFSSSFVGTKEFFINSELIYDIIDIFSDGLNETDTNKYINLECMMEVISNSPKEDTNELGKKYLITLQNIINEDNEDYEMILLETRILKKILKKNGYKLQEMVSDIIQILDDLIDFNNSIEFITNVFKCYKYVADIFKEDFFQFSDQLINKMSQFINDPLNFEYQFFLCIEILPSLKMSIKNDTFNELLMNSMHFILNEIYDENGNEKENCCLTTYDRYIIINFLQFSIGEEIIQDMLEIIEIIILIAYHNASTEPEFEIINNFLDMTIYKNCIIIPDQTNDNYILIGHHEITKIQNSILILTTIFAKKEIELSEEIEEIKEMIPQLLELPLLERIVSQNDFCQSKNNKIRFS